MVTFGKVPTSFDIFVLVYIAHVRLTLNVSRVWAAGWTPLHEACIHGWWSVARALLAAGAGANRPGLDRVTPLHDAAAGSGRRRLVRLLLRYGADPTARTARGQPAAELATERRVRLLLERAAAVWPAKLTDDDTDCDSSLDTGEGMGQH